MRGQLFHRGLAGTSGDRHHGYLEFLTVIPGQIPVRRQRVFYLDKKSRPKLLRFDLFHVLDDERPDAFLDGLADKVVPIEAFTHESKKYIVLFEKTRRFINISSLN